MKQVASLLLFPVLAVILMTLTACPNAGTAHLVLYAEIEGIGFVRSDTVIFVGQGTAAMQAGGFWKVNGLDAFPPKAVQEGKLVVINRELDYKETFEPGEPIPIWALQVFRGMTDQERRADAARLGISFQ